MPGEKRFSEVQKMMEAKGYALARVSGSHHVFTKAGARSVPIPVHKGKVMLAYVRLVERLEA